MSNEPSEPEENEGVVDATSLLYIVGGIPAMVAFFVILFLAPPPGPTAGRPRPLRPSFPPATGALPTPRRSLERQVRLHRPVGVEPRPGPEISSAEIGSVG
jgi:hypothetical protein